MSSYYDDEDELDIRVIRQRQRSRSPAPAIYPEHRYRHVPRPIYETHGSNYLIPAVSMGGAMQRSRSTGHREERRYISPPAERRYASPPAAPPAPPPAPVVINNTRIYNDYEDDDYLPLAPRRRSRSRSHSRPTSFISPHRDSHHDYHHDYELEKTRKELEAYKLEKEKEKEEKRIKKELELHRLREEKKEEEEKERLKKETEEAIEKYKQKEAKKAAEAKKEKEEREKEYQQRFQEDLRKSGMDERQIAVVLKKDQGVDPNRPTYTRMSRRHLSIETLNRYRIDYEFDNDPDFVLIKRWVPEYEQDFLWSHTREIRERRKPVMVAIEGRKHHHEEPEFEFIRKKKHERKPSPSPLLTFLAGGKR